MKAAWHRRQQKHLLPKLTLIFFKIMGLAPFALQNSTKVKKPNDPRQSHRRFTSQFVSSRLGQIYNVCLIFGQLCMAFLAMGLESVVEYPYKSSLTKKIELALTIGGNGVVAMIWLIYCMKQNTLAMLVNRLTHVYFTLDGVKGTSVGVYQCRSGLRNFIILFATNTFIWILLLLSEELAFHEPMIRWFSFIVPSIIINWFTLQFVLAIDLIKDRFKLLNNVLLRCSTTSVVFPLREFCTGLVTFDDFRVPKMVTLRKAHTSLYEISSGIAEFYSLPILLVIGFNCIFILYNAYYLVIPFELGAEKLTLWMMASNSVLWLLILMFPLIKLVAAVNGVTKEMKKTADVIPNLLAQPTTSYEDKTELEKFAFEMLHKDVQYTGYRLFPLDSTLLQSIFGMVGSYLTIMFQMQAGSSKSGGLFAYNSSKLSTKTS